MHTLPVKWYYGGSDPSLQIHPTYPILSNAPGSGLSVLDACLINGFGEVSVSSLTIDAAGIATATANSHGYTKTPIVILVTGADQNDINGEWELLSVTTNTLTFNAKDSPLRSVSITGANIKIKIAPLGWSKPFQDLGNFISVYRSKDPLSRRHFLRVDDADGPSSTYRCMWIRGYESMQSTSDLGSYPFPQQASFGRGLSLARYTYTGSGIWSIAGNLNISWTLVGTSRQFYFFSHWLYGDNQYARMYMFFGDLVSYVPGDYGATGIAGGTAGTNAQYIQTYLQNVIDYKGYTPRNLSRLHSVSDQRFRLDNLPGMGNSTYVIGNGNNVKEPDLFSNRLILYRPFFIRDEAYPNNIRGEMPGMSIVLNDLTSVPLNYTLNKIITSQKERFIFTPISVHFAVYGFFLLSIDRDWNQPIVSEAL